MWKVIITILVGAAAPPAENSPAGVVATLWRALSNEPGAGADVATLRALFHDQAVVFGGRYDDGAPALTRPGAPIPLTGATSDKCLD